MGADVEMTPTIDWTTCFSRGSSYFHVAPFASVYDVCSVPVHLLLDYNKEEPECTENSLLGRLDQALDHDDDDGESPAVLDADVSCRDLFLPFLSELQQVLSCSSAPPSLQGVPLGRDGIYHVRSRLCTG